jgi:hypothetical protein
MGAMRMSNVTALVEFVSRRHPDSPHLKALQDAHLDARRVGGSTVDPDDADEGITGGRSSSTGGILARARVTQANEAFSEFSRVLRGLRPDTGWTYKRWTIARTRLGGVLDAVGTQLAELDRHAGSLCPDRLAHKLDLQDACHRARQAIDAVRSTLETLGDGATPHRAKSRHVTTFLRECERIEEELDAVESALVTALDP